MAVPDTASKAQPSRPQHFRVDGWVHIPSALHLSGRLLAAFHRCDGMPDQSKLGLTVWGTVHPGDKGNTASAVRTPALGCAAHAQGGLSAQLNIPGGTLRDTRAELPKRSSVHLGISEQ